MAPTRASARLGGRSARNARWRAPPGLRGSSRFDARSAVAGHRGREDRGRAHAGGGDLLGVCRPLLPDRRCGARDRRPGRPGGVARTAALDVRRSQPGRRPAPHAEWCRDDRPRHRSRHRQHRLRRRAERRLAPARARRGRDRDAAPASPLERRLADIHARVGELLDAHQPDAVAIEELYFGANVRTAFAVGQARGVVLLAAGQRGVPSRSYTPQQVKGAVCGNGRAGKDQVGADGRAAARPGRAADARPRRRRARGGDLRPQPRAAGAARVAAGSARMIALVSGHGRGPPRRPRRRRLRRRRLPARGLGRDAPARARRRPRGLLHTHLVVRDDALALYGFATEEERELFLMLLGVQSVGPKVALAVLSGGPPRELLAALAAGDTARLQAVPGIGKRTAERIIVELREKVGATAARRTAITVTRADDPRVARPRGPARARLQRRRGRRAARRRRRRRARGPDRPRAEDGRDERRVR